jgi:hypothetical protein
MYNGAVPHRTLIVWLLAAAAALAGLWLGRAPAPTALDLDQPRLDQPAPLVQGTATLAQSFHPAHNGLSAVELLAVVYDPPAGAAPSEPPTLNLQLLDPAGQPIASQTFSSLGHNASLTLHFAPQPRSSGQRYTLVLTGSPANPATAWAYSLDGYAGGDLRLDGAPVLGDLRFTTRYTYFWADAWRGVFVALRRMLPFAVPLWLVLFAPGLLLLALVPPARAWPTQGARWGAALALSLALLAVAWAWIGVFGLHWSPPVLAAVYAAVGLALLARSALVALRARAAPGRPAAHPRLSPANAHTALLLLILAVGLATRLLAVRDLVLPQWVDGPHHYTIARLLAEHGSVPPTYQPVLPIDRFLYHFGFHALAVSVHWLSGAGLADNFLLLGQVLHGLVPLSAYAGVSALTGRRRAGLFASAFIAFVSLFPAYYLTWGRYTHLAGVLLLYPALALAWRLGAVSHLAGRLVHAVLLGLLAAGLLLTHYVVFVFWLAFAAVAVVFGLARRPQFAPGGPRLLALLAAALAGLALAAPWLWRLASRLLLVFATQPQRLAAPVGYNAFPFDYFTAPLERAWLLLAAAALAVGLLRRNALMAAVAAWLTLLAVLVNIGPGNWLVTNNALAITLFVPGSLALGWGADRLFSFSLAFVRRLPSGASAASLAEAPAPSSFVLGPSSKPDPLRIPLYALRFAPLALLSLVLGFAIGRGLPAQVAILNPDTTLVYPADRPALEWIEQNAPADAVFLINAWEWLNGTWAGSDAGGWIWPLTGRRATLPAADYAYASLPYQAQVNDLQSRLNQIGDAANPAALALLQEAGVTHVFIGARGGRFTPEMFVGRAPYTLLFTNGAAWIFAVAYPQ